MIDTLIRTEYSFPYQEDVYYGKVRDVYNIAGRYLVMVVTDRISAFDCILPRGIPYKGQVLNQIAVRFMEATNDIVPNWQICSPHPMVTIGYKCEPVPVEMIIRGYLSGSAWRLYKSGFREICGIRLADGLRENQQFPEPLITPTTKAEQGLHDENISREQILEKAIVSEQEYNLMEKYTLELFKRGSEIARQHGLILVDTKYEFGRLNGKICLIDEIHTPDSSRYFYLNEYHERFKKGLAQKQLSKEFVREWLMNQGFTGQPGQTMPRIPDDFILQVSERYIELFENITGKQFKRVKHENLEQEIYQSILQWINTNIDKIF